MGKAIIDSKITREDIESLRLLHAKVNPGVPPPPFGAPNQETWVMRDEKDRARIVGFIHFEHAIEVRAMVTDPDYENRQMALTVAYNAYETCMRRDGHAHYYITVPKEHRHVARYYEDEEGAVRIDNNTIRFMRRL